MTLQNTKYGYDVLLSTMVCCLGGSCMKVDEQIIQNICKLMFHPASVKMLKKANFHLY